MRFANLLLVIAALGISAGAAQIFFKAADVDPHKQERVRIQSAIDTELKAANSGDVRAQHRVAELYRTAKPPVQNFTEARKWYQKAAEQGHPLSQYALGNIYAQGLGVRQDYYRAAEWYRLAANLTGNAKAQFALGELYFYGRGVPSSYGLAVEWYGKAANQGHAIAQFFLGKVYHEGWGAEKNLVEAYKWMTLANRNAPMVAAHNERNDPNGELEKIKSEMNSSQIRIAEKAARDWKPSR